MENTLFFAVCVKDFVM